MHARLSPALTFSLVAAALLTLPAELLLARDTTQALPHYPVTVEGTDTVWADELWPAYLYTMVNDSMVVTCDYARIALNSSHFYLQKWFSDSLWDEEESALSGHSRTKNRSLSTGDTISFVRRLSWYPTLSGYTDSSNFYYSRDTLAYVVKLHRTSDDAVMAVLDTIGLLAMDPPGFPAIFGTCDLTTWIKYVVPEPLNGTMCYVKIWTTARGAGSYNFMRFDSRKARFELLAGDTNELGTTAYYCGMGKRVARQAVTQDRIDILTRVDGRVITVDADFRPGDHIVLADDLGRIVQWAAPMINSREISISVASPGTFFVVLLRRGVRVGSTLAVVR